jgi:hypothetical protein
VQARWSASFNGRYRRDRDTARSEAGDEEEDDGLHADVLNNYLGYVDGDAAPGVSDEVECEERKEGVRGVQA